MIKRRSRFKQTTTLKERLLKYTTDLQQQANRLAPGTAEGAEVREKIRTSEAALRFDALVHEERKLDRAWLPRE